jgi:hypothetical protein
VADVGYLYFFATSAQGVRSTLFFSAPDSPAIIPNPLSALHLLILVLHNLLFMTGQKWAFRVVSDVKMSDSELASLESDSLAGTDHARWASNPQKVHRVFCDPDPLQRVAVIC